MPRVTRNRSAVGFREKDLTRGEEAYRKIRDSILKGTRPPATPLSEYALAAQFKLSRTPVREALTRLEQEGMVRTVPGRGTFVSELTPHDIMEIYQVREQLESFAARLAAEQMGPDGLLKLEHIIQEMHQGTAAGHSETIVETDVSLHKTIIGATQNHRMINILATLDDQMHRIRSLWLGQSRWLEGTLAEHDLIAKAITDRNPDGAEAAMRKHLRSSCEHVIRFLMPMRRD
jgi:GntR family transcriptional regulator, rspAB operon transcriptional repressor